MKVFLSYAKEDGAVVKEFHDQLKALGLDPWMDQERLLPGQSWEHEIDRALNAANVVILFMSLRSVKKRSFVTREANAAVSNLRYKKSDDIYIIPVLLESCEIPEEIAGRAQYILFTEPGAKNKIIASIMRAAEQQDISVFHGVEHGPYQVHTRTYEEEKSGQPGHSISLHYPKFESPQFPDVAHDLTKLFAGRAAKILLDYRSKPWEKESDLYPEPKDEFEQFHANGRWEYFSVVTATQNLVSVRYDCSWYGAGAAHSQEYNECFNFCIFNSHPYPFTLRDLFMDGEEAAEIISQECRKAIAREYWNRCKEDICADEFWHTTFLENTAPVLTNFENFNVADDKLIFYFTPYQVAAYGFGSFSVDVPFYELREVFAKGDKSPLAYER